MYYIEGNGSVTYTQDIWKVYGQPQQNMPAKTAGYPVEI
jgi:hypothetical protein